ncbi:MAG: endonuclease/exonuclease/phosphatase family protein [Planctomycetota bacterium]
MKRWSYVVGMVLCFSHAVVVFGQETKGLPADAGIPVIDWKDAGDHIDQQVIVQGQIVQTRNIGKMCFLNFDTSRSFTAVVRQEHFEAFPQPPEAMYDQKIVRIRGTISVFRDKPQVEVSNPSQITILDAEKPIEPQTGGKPKVRPFTGTVTIAAYNTLNLFDEYNDPYHEDEGTPAKPKEQLELLAKAIRALDADVISLEEVESRDYLERFVKAMLPDMGYQEVVCFESNDVRGIDCAVLSRFPVGPVTSYRHLKFPDGDGKTIQFQRDLIQVQIQPPEGPAFYMFPVHFKSKRGGEDTTATVRIGETRQARKILDDLLKREKDALFVVLGDFNDTWDSAAMKAIRGDASGELKGFVQDAPKEYRTFNSGEFTDPIDFILASPAMAKRYVPKSYRIPQGTVESSGSDHNPVVAQFKLK